MTLWPIGVTYFFKVFRSQVFSFQLIGGSKLLLFFLTETAHEISSVLLSQRPDLDLNFGHWLVTFYVPFLSQIAQNLTGEFMWKISAASGNLFTDS